MRTIHKTVKVLVRIPWNGGRKCSLSISKVAEWKSVLLLVSYIDDVSGCPYLSLLELVEVK